MLKRFISYWIIVVKLYWNILYTIADKNCPIICECTWIMGSLKIDCSDQALSVYPDFKELNVEHLDLSKNQYTTFPKHMAKYKALTYLDLSNNRIHFIESTALIGFNNLRTLNLAKNGIRGLQHIHIKELFQNANNLNDLNLNDNMLKSFNYIYSDNADENGSYHHEAVQSISLEHLHMDNCHIDYFYLNNTLPNLKYLSLNNNLLKELNEIVSNKLETLEAANCSIREIKIVSTDLTNLKNLNLRDNLLYEIRTTNLNVATLENLDLSNCYLSTINISECHNLKSIKLAGNSLRHLNDIILPIENHIEFIDISRNFLTYIDVNSFSNLTKLKHLDLSYNEIKYLHEETFHFNRHLESLNLSHNVIEVFPKIISNSLRHIDLSWCPIMALEQHALNDLQNIQKLNLSNNLLRELPTSLASKTLQHLDLSYGRLIHLNEKTFQNLPELHDLRLNSNRFTQPFTMRHFLRNKHLTELWLDDNLWICNCSDKQFENVFKYFMTPPRKIFNVENVKCSSPIHLFGKSWPESCDDIWSINDRTDHLNSNNNKKYLWFLLLLSVAIMFSVFITLKCFKKYLNYRRKQRDHEQFTNNQRELRNVRRLNRQILNEAALPNAPNAPNASNIMSGQAIDMLILPSYEDALKMPKPIRSTKSLLDFSRAHRNANNKYHPDIINTENYCDNEDDYQHQYYDNYNRNFHHKNYYSLDTLTQRAQERLAYIEPQRRFEHQRVSRTNHFNEYKQFAASSLKTTNLQSAEQIENFQSYKNSPYTKRKAKYLNDYDISLNKRCTIRKDSMEFLTDYDIDIKDVDVKQCHQNRLSQSKPLKLKSCSDNDNIERIVDNDDHLLPPIENYYSAVSEKLKRASDSDCNDSDFHILIQPDIHSIRDDDDWENYDIEMETVLQCEDNSLIKREKLQKKQCMQAKENAEEIKEENGEQYKEEEEEEEEVETIVMIQKSDGYT